MRAFIHTSQQVGLLLVRVAVGFILLMHGYHRYQAGPAKVLERINEMGLPGAEALAWGTIAFEVIGGLLIMFGLGTPILGGILVVEQVLLIVLSKWQHGFDVVDGGYEYNLALAALGLVLLVFGSGRMGLDALFTRPAPDPEQRWISDSDPA